MKRRLTKKIGRFLGLSAFLAGAAVGLQVLTGCASMGVGDQRFVSKPNMEFSRSAVYSYSSKIMPQIQPGLAVSGGAQASTCTSCR